jgi:hypothetical protein
MVRRCAGGLLWLIAVAVLTPRGDAAVPIGGFLPLVGIGLTDEFSDDFEFFPGHASSPSGGTLLGAGGDAHYDLALLDTGAGFSLLTAQAFQDFGLNAPSLGEPDGYNGTEEIAIGGATGQLSAEINDPFGLYAGGLQGRAQGPAFAMDDAALRGQTNTATITIPAESALPNVVGLSYASQFATMIRNDMPQIFQKDGQTVRSPAIEFHTLGSGGQGITRRAPLMLNPGESFQQAPSYFPNIENLDIDNPQENPSIPTIIQGALYLSVNASNNGNQLNNTSFFFDTGADVTVVSELNAVRLGFDPVLDTPDFTVAVVGSGGTKLDVPGFFADSFTIQAVGGSLTLNNVPIVVLDVANPASPSNIVDGIVGTNLLSGRNVVIDPKPSLGGGGPSPSLYISDPVTKSATFIGPMSNWYLPNTWNNGAVPDVLTVVDVNYVPGSNGRLLLNDATAWSVNVSGQSATETMELQVQGGTLTTFADVTVEDHGLLNLFGTLDAQYVDLRGGRLRGGSGSRIVTGSGPIAGQLENVGGVLEVHGELDLEGRYANAEGGTFEVLLRGDGDDGHGRLNVEGAATLAGTLRATPAPSPAFNPAPGSTFTILSTTEGIGGEFDLLDLPALTGGKTWQVVYEELDVLLRVMLGGGLAGDFNIDGSVNAADLAVWRSGFGTQYDANDFLDWQRNLGAGGGGASAVPEPGTAVLVFAAAAPLLAEMRRSRRDARRFGLVA